MVEDGRWPTRGRDLTGVAVAVVLGWLGVLGDGRVPLLALVDLGFHELGHLIGYIVRPPELVIAALGSFTQVTVPLGLAAYFLLVQHDRLGTAVCLAWAATAASSTAAYVADAPTQQLALIGGEHDWAFILGPDGLDRLDQAAAWAGAIRGGAWLCMALAAAVSLWPVIDGQASRRATLPGRVRAGPAGGHRHPTVPGRARPRI